MIVGEGSVGRFVLECHCDHELVGYIKYDYYTYCIAYHKTDTAIYST